MFQTILQTILNSVQGMAMYSLATFGIVLVFRTSATTNFAQGIIATIGCYVTTQFCVIWGLPLVLSLPIGMLVAFLLGMLVDVGIIRRGKNVDASSKQMITMGILMVLTVLVPVIFSYITITTPATPNYSTANVNFKLFGYGFYIPVHSLVCLLLAVVLLSAVFAALNFTKWGLGVRATASNELVAKMMGVNTMVITAVSWAIAGALATVTACSMQTVLNAAMMGNAQIYGFLACVLGGLTSFFSPIIGAMLIPLIINFAASFAPKWANLVMFSVVLLLILIRPNGLFGKKFIKKV